MRKLEYLIYAIAIFFVLFLCVYLPQRKPDVFSFESKSQLVNVTKGQSAARLAYQLKQKGLISSAKFMRVWLALSGTDKQLKVGSYRISTGTIFDVARQLKTAKPECFAVSVIPGRSLTETAQGLLDKKKLLEAMSDNNNFPTELQSVLPKDTASRIIFMLPETYFLAPNGKVETQLVKTASKLWYERIGKKIPAERFNAKTLLQLGIMASIVEGEARVKEDRPILASIFFKRLKMPMRLQSCATVMYCWKEFKGIKKTRLTYNDLNIDSPFNTYRHDGLPPAPINFPSADSWNAAVNCGETEYLYFVADGKGKHLFSKTYNEHLARQKGLH